MYGKFRRGTAAMRIVAQSGYCRADNRAFPLPDITPIIDDSVARVRRGRHKNSEEQAQA